jgi:RimJ/RimL family protein N-acetyltransferase
MQTIHTDRLIIRNFRPEDWRDLHEMIVQYQASEYYKYDHQWPTAEEEFPKIAGWFSEGDSYMAVCLPDTGKLLGFVCLNPEEGEDGPVFNLGYIFNSDYSGQGYATEACQAALTRAFEELGAARLVTGTPLAHEASCRLLARLGFHETGGGMFSLLRDEWLARCQALDGNAA